MAEGEGFAHEVTEDNLEQFAAILRETSTPGRPEDAGGTENTTGGDTGHERPPERANAALPDGLFDGDPFRVELGRDRPTRRTPTRGRDEAEDAEETEEAAAGPHGPLLWRKPSLSATDAQRQTGHRTGSMRLTQAGWKIDGTVIDQTAYFREDVFGDLDWGVGSEDPYREDARAMFNITVRGRSLGTHELRITHKPSGEAGQGNYTTSLHWEEVSELIRELDVEGDRFELYGPPPGEREPFFVVIG